MATIDIKRSHKLSKEDARKHAEDLAKNLESRMGITWRWDGDTVQFEASSGVAKGVKGHLSVHDTELHVAVDLPFMLRPMKGTIEDKINEKLANIG